MNSIIYLIIWSNCLAKEALQLALLKKLNPRSKRFQIVSFFIFSTLVVVVAAFIVQWEFYDPEKVFALLREEETGQGQSLSAANQGRQDDNSKLPLSINIVFLGLDITEQVERFGRQEISDRIQPDTIIFATLDIREKKVKAISISRDSKVPIIGRGINDKINHAYYYGAKYGEGVDEQTRAAEGIRFTLEAIENLMEASVDFHITIDIDCLIKIVDLMGGVYYDVEQDIRADLGQGRVLIEKGYQHLDGEHFFYYIQYRDLYGRNHDRMDRQQRIIKSTFKQYRDTGKISKIPAVIHALRNSIVTNLDSRYIGALLRFARELEPDSITFYSFEGEGIFTELGYYFYIDEEHRAAVLDEMLGVKANSLGIIKGVPIEFEGEDEEYELNLFQGDFRNNDPLFLD